MAFRGSRNTWGERSVKVNAKCTLGFHDFYSTYHPLVLESRGKATVVGNQLTNIEENTYQYMTIKRICVHCKKKEEFIVQLADALQNWDVVLSAPNFLSEERRKIGERE